MASIEYRARSTRVIAYINKEKQVFLARPSYEEDG